MAKTHSTAREIAVSADEAKRLLAAAQSKVRKAAILLRSAEGETEAAEQLDKLNFNLDDVTRVFEDLNAHWVKEANRRNRW